MSRLLICVALFIASLGCRPTPVVNSTKQSAATTVATTSEAADPVPTNYEPPPPETTSGEPQIYERSEPAEVAALADTPLEELLELFAEPNRRDAASRAVIKRGSAAIEPLIDALQSTDPQVRAAAAFTLGQLGSAAQPAVEALQSQAKQDEDEIARDAAAFAIDAIEEPES